MWNNWYNGPSRPIPAKGGIKARSKGKTVGESWWAKRWISILERYDFRGRLDRGRSYARNGQVLSISVDAGLVTAKVQGSRSKPYDVTIEVDIFSKQEWRQVVELMRGELLLAAKLAAGEMPPEIEETFCHAGLSLFPDNYYEIRTDCSCPDWSFPCKHIAAVYYLLGEEFDRDPFLLFRLRGMEREALITKLSGRKRKVAGPEVAGTSAHSEPLRSDVADFWGNWESLPQIFGDLKPPPVSAALLRQLGEIPFWRADESIGDTLSGLYDETTRRTFGRLQQEP